MSYRSIRSSSHERKNAVNLAFSQEDTYRASIDQVECFCELKYVEDSYHEHKYRAKAHSFVVSDIVYLARSKSDCNNNLKSKFDMVKYVIIDFAGRYTCKVVSTLDGKVYVRNMHLFHDLLIRSI